MNTSQMSVKAEFVTSNILEKNSILTLIKQNSDTVPANCHTVAAPLPWPFSSDGIAPLYVEQDLLPPSGAYQLHKCLPKEQITLVFN
jgi:hypothetical protein